MTYYYAGKPIGAINTMRADGEQEIGSDCGHKHDTIEAASKCADRQEARGIHVWGVYRGRDDKPAGRELHEAPPCKIGWVNAGHTIPEPHITS